MSDRRSTRLEAGGWLATVALFLLVAVGMSGCFTGERPTLAHEPTTGSPAVDAVIDRVNSLGDAVYTADYDVTAFDGQTRPVRASQSGASRRSLTIGDVRYIVDGSSTRTCTVSTGRCDDTIDASRVSDVQLNPDFFGTSLAARIRHDAEIAVGEPTASTEELLGQTATCAAIPVEGRGGAEGARITNTYCVLDNGVLARLDAGDVDVTMTAYEPGADAALFTPTGS
jgi:hypothetical protein